MRSSISHSPLPLAHNLQHIVPVIRAHLSVVQVLYKKRKRVD